MRESRYANMRRLESPHQRTTLVKTGENITNGREMAKKAAYWMEVNQDAFNSIYQCVKHMQDNGYKGRVRDRVAMWCLDHNVKIGYGSFKLTNGYWAAIARYLVIYDPSLENAPIVMHDSDIDCWGLYPISWMEKC